MPSDVQNELDYMINSSLNVQKVLITAKFEFRISMQTFMIR